MIFFGNPLGVTDGVFLGHTFRTTFYLIQANWYHCIFLRDLSSFWPNHPSPQGSQPGLTSPAQYPGIPCPGTRDAKYLERGTSQPFTAKNCLLTMPIHLTKKHWIPYSFCPSYYSDLIFPLPPCTLHLSFYWDTSWSYQALSTSSSLQILFLLLLSYFLFQWMSSNPSGLSSGTISSSKLLLVTNPDWDKRHS